VKYGIVEAILNNQINQSKEIQWKIFTLIIRFVDICRLVIDTIHLEIDEPKVI
jgi:hypothetical protein